MNLKITFAVLLCALLFSCRKDEITPEYIEARDAWGEWKEAKAQNGNSYAFKAVTTSFANTGTSTEIRVENGVVTSRKFKAYTLNRFEEDEVFDSYEETGADVGLNQKGLEPMTIDELYRTCLNDYLQVDPERNTLYFTTIISGAPGMCGYVPANCMDDCYTGFRIQSFGWN